MTILPATRAIVFRSLIQMLIQAILGPEHGLAQAAAGPSRRDG
jgi:hypothetical protein